MTNTNVETNVETNVRVRADGAVDRRHDNPGRPCIFGEKEGVLEGLNIVRDAGEYLPAKENAPMSRTLTLQLVNKGYLSPVDIKGEGRGRPKRAYKLTSKGRNYIHNSKRWKT